MSRQPPKVPRPTPAPRVRTPHLEELATEDIPAFWERLGRTPLVQGTGLDGEVVVTFLWRDHTAEQVLLFANRLTDETRLADTLMERLPGTDLWHASFRMRSDWRASYSFLVQPPGERAPWLAAGDQVALRAALDRGRRDLRNPDTCRNAAGVLQSVVSLPCAPSQPWLAERPGVPGGTLVRLAGPDGRDLWLHDPPGALDEPLPLLVVLDGEVWVERQSLPTTLDNLLADGEVGPLRSVFVSSGGREARWAEHGADGGAVAYVVEQVLPWVAARRGLRRGPENVTIAGQSLGGLTALRSGLRHPQQIGNVVSHSASLWQDDLVSDLTTAAGLRVHLAHGSQEWVLAEPHRELAHRLRAAGAEVDAVEHNGGHDYAWWRGGVADGLRWVTRPRPAPA